MLVGDVDCKINQSEYIYKLWFKLGKAFNEAARKDPEWNLEEE
tara:strand:+ start:129 stop:257 length:129 start_codon:yes stop_codon:yes gene_type:complete